MVPHLSRLKYWLGWSLLTLILVKIIQSGSLTTWLPWLFHRPIATLINLGIVLAIFLLFYALFANRRSATLMGLWLMISFAIIHYLKLQHLQDNLYSWDFLIIPEMLTLLPTLKGELFFAALLPLLFIPVTLLLVVFSFRHRQKGLLKRLALLGGSVCFLGMVSSVILIPRVDSYLTGMIAPHDYIRDYERNGLMFSFARTVKTLLNIETPEQYSKNSVEEIIRKPIVLGAGTDSAVRPNVIMVMSEALFDPTDLPLTYSKDPLQHMHALQDKHGKSLLVSPSHGGNTCNTEFEVLTGLTMNFFPPGSLPYQHYIRRELPALPRIFKENGYQTLAIHPYRKTFFSREKIYQLLGFDDYISLEDWDNPEIVGDFVSDRDVVRKIIESSEKFDGPYFIFAITMQNHQPFTTPHDPDLTITSGNLTAQSKERLTGYLAGVQDADQSLLALIDQVEKSPRPTIVVYFGDHLPAIPTVYEETAYFEGSENVFAKYTVPALIWSNYKQIPPLQRMSIFYLGDYVLKQAGITPPLHFELLGEMAQIYPIISYSNTQSGSGALLSTHDLIYSDKDIRNIIQDYWILQHDLIFGEQHLWESSLRGTESGQAISAPQSK